MRFTADAANVFVRLGVPTTVWYPAVDWWDFKWFTISGLGFEKKWKWILKVLSEVVIQVPQREPWCGFKVHRMDPRIRAQRYRWSPNALDLKEDEITVVHPPYVIPHLLRTLPPRNIKLVGVMHINMEEAIRSPSPEMASWFRHCLAQARLLASIPWIATSEKAGRAAQRLGVPIRRVIDTGVDLSLFHPRRPSSASSFERPLVVTLFCDHKVQKGQGTGVEAVRRVKERYPNRIQLCSIGRVLPEFASAFDRHFGYLHAEAYADALRETDIFVYPSLYDGFPAPPLEALACGSALVTTSVEGVTEYAANGENCLLCRPGDPDGMQVQIERLLQDAPLRERLRANGPLTAQAYSVERCGQELLEFLREVYEEELAVSLELAGSRG